MFSVLINAFEFFFPTLNSKLDSFFHVFQKLIDTSSLAHGFG